MVLHADSLRLVEPHEPAAAPALARLLEDGVASGASVGFLWPMAEGEALAWAEGIVNSIGPGLVLWFAERGGEVIGTVQLVPVLKANGRHRAEVSKLLVHRDARGAGVATRLLQALEAHARTLGITLLALDTEAGSAADKLYTRDGWRRMGEMPGHSVSPNGVLHDTAYFFKVLG
jgi:acetyltransferase